MAVSRWILGTVSLYGWKFMATCLHGKEWDGNDDPHGQDVSDG